MLQIILENPGRLAAREVAEPVFGPDEALVRVHRIGICGTDLHAFAGRQPFFTYPRVLGHELGVEVLAVGDKVSGVAIHDRCAVEPYLNCGTCFACLNGKSNCCENLRVMGVHRDGGMQSLLAVPAAKLHVSRKLSLDQLALVETLGIGAHAVARAAPRPGEGVLVVGAGPIGLSVTQFAMLSGANVAVADVNAARLEFCRKALGVSVTIDLSSGPEQELIRDAFGGRWPAVVMDATGHPASMAAAFNRVAHGGRIVFVGLFPGDVTFHDPEFHRRELTLMASRNSLPEDFRRIISLIEAGRLDTTPWITARLALQDVPTQFARIAEDRHAIKAMIEVNA